MGKDVYWGRLDEGDAQASGMPFRTVQVIITDDKGRQVGMDINSLAHSQRTIFLEGPLMQANAQEYIKQIKVLDTQWVAEHTKMVNGKPVVDDPMAPENVESATINIYINSPGGSIFDALLPLYDAMNSTTCPISTVCNGIAMSAASLILAAGTPGMRYVSPNSYIMIHQLRGGGGGGMQTQDEQEANAKISKDLEDRLEGMYVHHTGQDLEIIHGWLHNNGVDTFLSADEAITMGLVDGYIDLSKYRGYRHKSLLQEGRVKAATTKRVAAGAKEVASDAGKSLGSDSGKPSGGELAA